MTDEQKIQTAIIKWTQQSDIRAKYPQLKLLYHVPNERKCSAQYGHMLKEMGVKSGVPDLCLPVPRGQMHGLYIELKTMARTAKPSEAQLWWLQELQNVGYVAVVCRGYQQAVDMITAYLDWRRPPHDQG